MELFNKIKTFLASNHIWMRIYKPHELSDPIAKAITESGNETSKILKDVFSKVSSLKGEKGDRGEKGDKGDKGDRGESIKGDKGDRGNDGKDGKDGKDGYTPIKNVDYFDGKDGNDGKDGEDGDDGYSPKKGKDYFTKKEIGEIVKLASEKASVAKQTVYSLWQRAIGVKNLDDVDLTAPTNGQALTYSNGKWINATVSGSSGTVALQMIIDGGGSAITTGVKGYMEIPFAMTITGWTLVADQSGSIVVDVWKDTYANFPPTVADTISGSEKPTLSSAQKNQYLALSTWTTSVTAGDILGFNVDSVSTVTRVTLTIRGNKS